MSKTYPAGFDAHTHLDFPEFDRDREAIVERAKAAGVTQLLVAGADPINWSRILRISAQFDALCVLGIHPWWVDKEAPLQDWLDELPEHLTPHGLGEIGLDFFRAKQEAERALQIELFRKQLSLARSRNIPIIVHCVRAHGPLLDILQSDGLPSRGGMIHGFGGSPEEADRAMKLGLYLSFGSVTYRSKMVQRALKRVPIASLLLETDCPGQHKLGKPRSEPADLVEVATFAAEIREASPSVLLHETGANARRLFEP